MKKFLLLLLILTMMGCSNRMDISVELEKLGYNDIIPIDNFSACGYDTRNFIATNLQGKRKLLTVCKPISGNIQILEQNIGV